MFLISECSLLRAEGLSCSLGVLYGGLGICKLQFLIKKIEIKFPAINIFQFQVIKLCIRIRNPNPQLEKMLDPDPYPDPYKINADPKPCNQVCGLYKKKVFQFLQGSYSVRLIINGILVDNVYCRYREQCLVLYEDYSTDERSFTQSNISGHLSYIG